MAAEAESSPQETGPEMGLYMILEHIPKSGYAPEKYKVFDRSDETEKYLNIWVNDFPDLEISRTYSIPISSVHPRFGPQIKSSVYPKYEDTIIDMGMDEGEEPQPLQETEESPDETHGDSLEGSKKETKQEVPSHPTETSNDGTVPSLSKPEFAETSVEEYREANKPSTLTHMKIPDDAILDLTADNIRRYLKIPDEVSDEEIMLAIQKCVMQGLNPFIFDVYLIPYNDKRTGETTLSLQISKEGFLKNADKHPDYLGFEAGLILEDSKTKELIRRTGTLQRANEILLGAYAKVFRRNMQPFYQEVSLHEYDANKQLWNSKKATMIRKTAIAQALREAFPNQFSGFYEPAEMDKEFDELEEVN